MNPKNFQPACTEREQENTPMTEPEYFRAIGRLEAQVQALTNAITEMKTKVDSMDTKLADLDRMAHRWKGGFAVALSLGAIAGILIDYLIRFLLMKP
jgi:hypothetical protein